MNTSTLARKFLITTAGTVLIALGIGKTANAATITTFYGDDDGFGIGKTKGNLTSPEISHQQIGEAPFTDQPLISNDKFYVAPAFTPSGSFNSFTINPGEIITSASLTLRTGAFDSGQATIDSPNRIFLNNLLVPSDFINGFSQSNSKQIETKTISLGSSFFPLLSKGIVSLAGTSISEDSGSGSFQIDFLRLDITTQKVPEHSSVFGLLAFGALGTVSMLKRKQNRKNNCKSLGAVKAN